jgi:hypothetical protein
MSIVQEVPLSDNRSAIQIQDTDEGHKIEITMPVTSCLLTHIAFLVKDTQRANQSFQLLTIETRKNEADDFTIGQDWQVPSLEPQVEFQASGTQVLLPCLAVAYAIRITFISPCYRKSEENEGYRPKASNTIKNFLECYSAFSLVGFNLNLSPSASHVVPLLNIAARLNNTPESADSDFLAGLALMSARRFVQAAEFLRRAEKRLIGAQDIPIRSPRHLGTPPFKAPAATNNKRLLKAAKYELLIVEGFNQHGQILDKLIAYQRATEMFLGGCELEAVSLSSDVYTCLLNLQPHLARLLLRNLQDKLEPLRIACVRGLEFLIENLGCALGNQIPMILKSAIKTYPLANLIPVDSFNTSLVSNTSLIETPFKDEPSQSLIDAYNRLMETFLTILSSASSSILHGIFHDILSHYLQISDLPKELRIYLLRCADKITQICEGDIEYSSTLLNVILCMKNTEDVSEHANRLWETIKQKVLPYYTSTRLQGIVQWLSEMMSSESEEENIPCLLEVVQLISHKEQPSSLIKTKPRPRPELQPLLTSLFYWLDYAASSQDRIELFQQVWQSLVVVADHFVDVSLIRFLMPLLIKTKEYCQQASPPLAMLKFLQIVLGDMKSENLVYEFILDFLPVFCQILPSNVQDEVFSVLNLMLQLVGAGLTEELLKTVIDTLLDQYTVKSNSQKKSKNYLISLILENHKYLEISLDYCLIHNNERKFDLDRVDKQRVLLEHDYFMEKLTFSIEILGMLDSSHAPIVFSRISSLPEVVEKLVSSRDSHIRIRGLEVLRLLGELSLACEGEESLEVSRCIMNSTRIQLEKNLDSKMVFFSLQLIDLVFKHLLPPRPRDKKYQEMRTVEALKLWACMQPHINSPWSNIRSIAFAVMCSWVQVELADLRVAVQAKLKSTLLPLLLSLLSSKESENRAGALNILGSFCGLSSAKNDRISSESFKKHSEHIPIAIWEQVYHLQNDWDLTIREASIVLIQLCAPREAVKHFSQVQREELSLRLMTQFDEEGSSLSTESQDELFWVDSYSCKEISELISMFRTDSRNPAQLWNEQRENREDEASKEPTEDVKNEDEEESLEQLGVIDLEDEELLEGCDDETNSFPVIKNAYARRKGQQRPTVEAQEDHTWSRPWRPSNASFRPFTPPAKLQVDKEVEELSKVAASNASQDYRVPRPSSRSEHRIDRPSNSPSNYSPPRQMAPSPPETKDLPSFDYEEETSLSHVRHTSIEELNTFLEDHVPKLKEDSIRISPRTPRKRIEQELSQRLKQLIASSNQPALSKIYMQKPDLAIFKKKTKPPSLNSSMTRNRRGAVRLSRTPNSKSKSSRGRRSEDEEE